MFVQGVDFGIGNHWIVDRGKWLPRNINFWLRYVLTAVTIISWKCVLDVWNYAFIWFLNQLKVFCIYSWFCQLKVCEIALNNSRKCYLILNWKFFCFGFCTPENFWKFVWFDLMSSATLFETTCFISNVYEWFNGDYSDMPSFRYFFKIVCLFVVAKFGNDDIWSDWSLFVRRHIFVVWHCSEWRLMHVLHSHGRWPHDQVIWLLF